MPLEDCGTMTQTNPATGTRDRLLAAAEACIARFGADKLTMDDVAKAAGMSRQTLYRHFTNKADLIEELGISRVHAINAAVAARVAEIEDPAQRIVEAILEAVQTVRNDQVSMALMHGDTANLMTRLSQQSSVLRDLHHQRLLPILEQAKSAGVLRPDIYLSDAVSWLVLLQITLVTWADALSLRPDALRRFVMTYVLEGLLRR